MRAILEFDLPEEGEEFDLHREGPAMFCLLSELMEWLRQKTKYEDVERLEVQAVRDRIAELIVDHRITCLE